MSEKDKKTKVNIEPSPPPEAPEPQVATEESESIGTVPDGEHKTEEDFLDSMSERINPKRRVGRPAKDEGLYNDALVRPMVITFSETMSRILGDKWELTNKEVDAWAAVTVPLLNKYASSTTKYTVETNGAILAVCYVGSRVRQGLKK